MSLYPEPRATRWNHCKRGGGPNCAKCVPPADQRCPEKIHDAPCLMLGDHNIHRDGSGLNWWFEECGNDEC